MIVQFILIFLLSILFIAILRRYAPILGLLDIPNKRSIHKKKTAHGAGIGFFLAFVLIFLIFNFDLSLAYRSTLLSIFMVFIIGVLDDHHDASPNTKFFVIGIATIFLSFDNILIDELGVYFGFNLSLGWLAIPFTIFAVVGFTNAMNLIDGLDGLAGMISIIILGSLFFIGFIHNDLFIMVISGSFISGLIGFLLFNWHPASIFMGDSGSLTLGFVISILAIKSLDYIPAVSILFIAALPILDTLVVMLRRKCNGKSVFAADKCHIHHILKDFFEKDVRKTVLFLSVLQAMYSLSGLQILERSKEGYLLILFILNIVFLYMIMTTMIKKQKKIC